MNDHERGWYEKYCVTKSEGETDPLAVYFVLRLDTSQEARIAARVYATLVGTSYPLLSKDIITKVDYMEKEAEDASL